MNLDEILQMDDSNVRQLREKVNALVKFIETRSPDVSSPSIPDTTNLETLKRIEFLEAQFKEFQIFMASLKSILKTKEEKE